MIITREVINKNIVYHDYNSGSKEFEVKTYQDLVNLINAYKNILIKNGAKLGETILVAPTRGFNNLAAFIAAAELGLGSTIVNSFLQKSVYYSDSKIKTLLPINYFIADEEDLKDLTKHQFYSMICDKVLVEKPNDFTDNKEIWATEQTVHHLSTSSGTSGAPKRIEHTHEFTYAVSKRNTSYMGKNIMITGRPTHGSSLATFYVPSVLSEKTENIYFCTTDDITSKELNKPNTISNLCDSLQIVYADLLDETLNKLTKNPNLTVFTLTAIRPEWLKFIRLGRIKNIISLYGTSETSGPIMMQYGNDPKFSPERFELMDDFYPVTFENGTLETIIPIYNRHNNTQDIVEPHLNGGLKLVGRKDLIRINDLVIPCRIYDRELYTMFSNATLTYDTLHSKIYLTLWYDDIDLEKKVNKFSSYLRLQSGARHFIADYDRLEYTEFLSGIKLDHEMIRQYYRQKHESNT
jgi:hypothetical protein